jgi:hypothetical protein
MLLMSVSLYAIHFALPQAALKEYGMDDETITNVDTDQHKHLSAAELAKQIKALTVLKRVKAEEERAAKPPTKRGRGILEFTKKTLLLQPEITNDELFKLVTEKCGTCSRIVMEAVRSDFKHTLKILREEGYYKDPEIVPEEEAVPEPPEGKRRRHLAAAE